MTASRTVHLSRSCERHLDVCGRVVGMSRLYIVRKDNRATRERAARDHAARHRAPCKFNAHLSIRSETVSQSCGVVQLLALAVRVLASKELGRGLMSQPSSSSAPAGGQGHLPGCAAGSSPSSSFTKGKKKGQPRGERRRSLAPRRLLARLQQLLQPWLPPPSPRLAALLAATCRLLPQLCSPEMMLVARLPPNPDRPPT